MKTQMEDRENLSLEEIIGEESLKQYNTSINKSNNFENDYIAVEAVADRENTYKKINKANNYYSKVTSATEAYLIQQKIGIINILKKIEEDKEEKRKKSIKYTWIVLFGLIIITVIIIFMIVTSILYFEFSDKNTISMMLEFLKFFIGSTVVEVIGLLYIITRYLFVDNFANSINSINDLLNFNSKSDERPTQIE